MFVLLWFFSLVASSAVQFYRLAFIFGPVKHLLLFVVLFLLLSPDDWISLSSIDDLLANYRRTAA
jgi:hypothetical protein